MSLQRMLRTLLGCAWLALAAGHAAAQSDCPPPAPTLETLKPQQLSADVRDRGFLWRLTRDGRTSWLYGTVHVSRPDWLLPGPRVRAAFGDSDVLALELDPGDPELQKVFMQRGDAARARRVTAGLDGRIAQIAARECTPAGSLSDLQPILQVTTLSLAESRRDGFHPELAVDAMLWGLARSVGKPLVALETAASQMEALLPASEADERVLVTQAVEEIEDGSGRRSLRRLLQAWADGDVHALQTYGDWCECMDTPQEQRYMQRLNDERNGPMADKLLALHTGGRSFFAAVGALHMTGAQALPQLLRARGFQVEPVAFSNSPGKP